METLTALSKSSVSTPLAKRKQREAYLSPWRGQNLGSKAGEVQWHHGAEGASLTGSPQGLRPRPLSRSKSQHRFPRFRISLEIDMECSYAHLLLNVSAVKLVGA